MRHATKAVHATDGFTLMELIIVLAIIVILGAIILPNFVGTTDKARIKSDIQSARVLQNAIEMYNAESATPLASIDLNDEDDDGTIAKLKTGGYLNDNPTGPQTAGAVWNYNSGQVKLNVSGCDASIKELCGSLSEQEQSFISGADADE